MGGIISHVNCKGKVKQQNNMFWCNTRNSESQFPMPRWPNSSLLILYNYSNDCIGKPNNNCFNYKCTNDLITLSNFSHYYIQLQSTNPSEGSYWDSFFVLFDKDAEKIIQKTAMELSSKVSNLNS